ncbi:hypothetical protein NQ317_000412 [Molorchus minor]|uniref:Uncharacterized protein n=1 Tax=Molorchus minor TaxID=1323400 RepID=A0ABQ9J9H5_9CUCU|nr:hypothetical protein NQ317_000412 [Molorchus minor]
MGSHMEHTTPGSVTRNNSRNHYFILPHVHIWIFVSNISGFDMFSSFKLKYPQIAMFDHLTHEASMSDPNRMVVFVFVYIGLLEYKLGIS